MAENLPSIDTLRLLLRYEPETGRLFWRERPESMFADGGHSAAHCAAKWNTRYAGKEALTALRVHGYRHGSVLDKQQAAHRVVWALVYGKWPSQDIDHINGDPADNRIINLRLVTKAENMRNQKRYATNKSGATGVNWFKRDRTWQAKITVSGQQVHLGYFKNIDDAIAARKAAEARYGFHENHGRVAA